MVSVGHDARECLSDHIRPRLAGWAESASTPGQYRALCPAHDDRRASLSLGVGDRGAVLWHCHAACSAADVRAAMVRAGVPDACLPRVAGQRTEDELASAISEILERGPSPAGWLYIAALVWHDGAIPRGAALAALAARIGIGRTAAYDARAAIGTATAGSGDTVSPPRRTRPTRLHQRIWS